MNNNYYKMSCGIETHVKLRTKTKLFCGCANVFGKRANTNCCPICLGIPGTLPLLNKKAIDYTVMAGISTNCRINKITWFDRKNYFYHDLPKGYQITQHDSPICYDGFIFLKSGKKIRINRIHLEEDAGKIINKDNNIYIDYNRSGLPLIEVVSEPDIETSEEAREYIEKIKLIMRYIGVSDCKMEEGSFRCDVNVSVRQNDQASMGVPVEIKNINSINHIVKAIDFEFKRQSSLIEKDGVVRKETRKYNESTKQTDVMRQKEEDCDYKYFKDPDLSKINIDVEEIKRNMVEDIDKRLNRYVNKFKLKYDDANNLIKFRKAADFFDKSIKGVKNKSLIARFILQDIFSELHSQEDKQNFTVNLKPEDILKVAYLVEENKINLNFASTIIKESMRSGKKLDKIINEKTALKISQNEVANICKTVIDQHPKIVYDYKHRNANAIQTLVGIVLKESCRLAEPKVCLKILKDLID